MGMLDSIIGSEGSTESRSVLSPEQRDLLKTVIGQLKTGLTEGATPSKLPAYATSDMFLQALEGAGSMAGMGKDTIVSALKRIASGTPAYSFDPGAITKEWQETYASPLMSVWRDEVAPVVASSYNVPGMFHSSLTGRGVSDAANRFYGSSVAPSLFSALQTGRQQAFQSGEAAAGRQLGGAQALGQLPMFAYGGELQLGAMELTNEERMLSALRGEEMRMMPEFSPWLQPAMSTALSQTMENIVTPGQGGMLGQAVGAGLGMATIGGMGMVPGLGDTMNRGANFLLG